MTQFISRSQGQALRRSLDAKVFQNRLRDRYRGLAKEQIILLQRRVAIELLRRIILKTPVDTGRARNGWILTVGQPATTSPIDGSNDINAQLSGALAVLASYEEINVLWITNNVTYIRYLEQGKPGPGSQQAPQGMVAVSLREVTNAL